MESSMVEENGNSSLDPMSEHRNEDSSTQQTQQQQQQSQAAAVAAAQSSQQQATAGTATLLTSAPANMVQFIPAQSLQVRASAVWQTKPLLRPPIPSPPRSGWNGN